MFFYSFPFLIPAFLFFNRAWLYFTFVFLSFLYIFNRACIFLFVLPNETGTLFFQSRMVVFYLMKSAYFYFSIAHIYFYSFSFLIPASIFLITHVAFSSVVSEWFIFIFYNRTYIFINFPNEIRTFNFSIAHV